MKDFKKQKQGSFGGQRDGGSFGRPSFGGSNRSSGGRDDGFGRSQMFEAVCANCGKKCEVPFRPNGQKPVYCRDCFGKQDRPSTGGSFQRRDFAPRPPFRPPHGHTEQRDGRIDDIKRQLEMLNSKLDQLLNTSKTRKEKGVELSNTEALAEQVEKEITAAKTEKKGSKKKPASKKR